MRAVLGLIVGLVVAFATMMLFALVGNLVFPVNSAVDPRNTQQVSAAFSNASSAAQLVVIVSWFVGALAGAAAAKLIARRSWPAWTVAILLTLYVVASIFLLPMAGWMQVVAVILPLVAGYIADHIPSRPRPAADPDKASDGDV